MFNIAVFASGSGTNAENLINYFSAHDIAKVVLVICNKPNAYVLERASRLGVRSAVLSRQQLISEDDPTLRGILRENGIDFIVLAGYLLQVPKYLINMYHERIVNIHPALLPSYGGKGMYGENVHKTVLKDFAALGGGSSDSVPFYSGITIHLVDEIMDHGKILFQSKFLLEEGETLESLEAKIHTQEQENFPQVVHAYLAQHH